MTGDKASHGIQRAVEILEFVCVQPRSQSEVAVHFDIHRSTAMRTLDSLVETGLSRKHADGRYGAGYRLAGLAQLALEQFDLAHVARPFLEELAGECQHTIHLAALDGRSIVYADKIDQPGMVRLYSQIGQAVTLHTAGVSKAILAYQPPSIVAEVLSGADFVRKTSNTITSLEAFTAQLETVREQGFAIDDAEFEDFINCVAMPIRDFTGEVMAAVSITALKARAGLDDLRMLLPRLTEITAAISKELGWRP
ncbi:IclR family transcriptional regulator [Cryobacterium melibiosiphilum]|uniref:IclR family transcriptional regulator n=1 Tax=Cryobacterium melibiosiphilum TaxID=995039 RepID=A0A3A5MN23_9MICO|nr:IclR family transcriptional regulator [Cryobacterium melibiosiphilum]RJT90451.1 IclR family transcriptional regulator [Cryobacterium melibiosiphilum]